MNDFRKITGLEAYAPTDNVSKLTARTNDEGWATVFDRLAAHQPATPRGCRSSSVFGDGNVEKNVSPNLVAALVYARTDRRHDFRHCRLEQRLYCQSADACCCSQCQPRQYNAARRSDTRQSSRTYWFPIQTKSRCQTKSEIDSVARAFMRHAVFFDRDGVLRPRHRTRSQAVSAPLNGSSN